MTIEEKAKAYDHALEVLHKYDKARIMFTQDLKEEMFPELKESEDERVIKEMIAYFQDIKKVATKSENLDKWIAYLEKQKEQISTRLNGVMQEYVKEGKDEEEQEHRLKCYKLFWDALEDSEFFEQFKQKEQKPPTEWSEKRIADVFEKVGFAKIVREQENDKLTNAVQSAMIELSKVENAECADDVVEEAEAYINGVLSERNRGTEWSEFDKGCLEDAICAVDILGNDESFNKSNPNLAKAFRVAKDWLKSLPLNLKKKNDDVAKLCSNEWSKEDEKIAKEIEEELWYPGDFPDYPSKEESELYDDCQRRLYWFKNKLKSLRPQPKQN